MGVMETIILPGEQVRRDCLRRGCEFLKTPGPALNWEAVGIWRTKIETAHAFQLDVTQEEDWRSVSVKSRDVGDVDIVVNNAGYFPNRSIDELDLPTWRKTMATNFDISRFAPDASATSSPRLWFKPFPPEQGASGSPIFAPQRDAALRWLNVRNENPI